MRIALLLVALAMSASCKREPGHGTATYVWMSSTQGCAELADHRWACWGNSAPPAIAAGDPLAGGTGEKQAVDLVLPKGVLRGSFKKHVAGEAHECVLLSNGDVRCWGKNASGELGDGTRNASDDVAVPVHGIEESMDLAAGAHHTCALQKSGLVACWGKNDRHQLASGTTEPSSRPVPIVGLVGVRKIAAARDGTCALLAEGEIRCWGGNDDGLLGDARKPDHEVPVTVMLPR